MVIPDGTLADILSCRSYILSSHMKKTTNDDLHRWCNKKYVNLKEVEVTRGPRNDFLRMTVEFDLETPLGFYES